MHIHQVIYMFLLNSSKYQLPIRYSQAVATLGALPLAARPLPAQPWGSNLAAGAVCRFPASMGKLDTRPDTRMLKRDLLETQHRLLGPTKRVETPTLLRAARQRLDSRGRSVGPRHMIDTWHLHEDMHLH